jgi:hypothetical protein
MSHKSPFTAWFCWFIYGLLNDVSSLDTSGDVVMSCELDDLGSDSVSYRSGSRAQKTFSAMSIGSLSPRKISRALKLTHLYLIPRLVVVELFLLSHIHLHGIVLN